MGFLDGIFGGKVSNPLVVSAIEKYRAETTDDNLVDLWQKFLKAKVLVATTIDGAKSFNGSKIREAVGLPFHTHANENGDNLLAVFTDNETFTAFAGETTPCVTMTGEQALLLTSAKGLLGMYVN